MRRIRTSLLTGVAFIALTGFGATGQSFAADAAEAEAVLSAPDTLETSVATEQPSDKQIREAREWLSEQLAEVITAPPAADASDAAATSNDASEPASGEADHAVEIFIGDTPVRTDIVILSPVPVPPPKPSVPDVIEINAPAPANIAGSRGTILASASRDLPALSAEALADGAQVAAAETTDKPASKWDSVQEVIFKAIEHHPRVLGRRAEIDVSDAEVSIAQSDFFPVLSVEAFSGYRNTDNTTTRAQPGGGNVEAWANQGTARLRQLIFDFMTTPSRFEAAKNRLIESQFVEADSQEQIGLRAVQAYLAVQRATLNLSYSRENVDFHTTTLRDIRKRAEAGAGDGGDVSQTESRLALAREFMLGFEEALAIAEADFKEAVGSMPGKLQPIKEPPVALPETVDAAVDIAFNENPQVIAAVKSVDAFGESADAAFGDQFPRFDLDLSYNRGNDVDGLGGNDEESRAVVRMSWELPTGLGKYKEYKRQLRLRDAAQQQTEERLRLVEESVRTSYAEVEKTREQIEQLKLRVNSARDVVTAYDKQFGAGRRTLLDLLDSENERFLAKVALNNGISDYVSAHYRLFTAMGRLRQALGLPTTLVEPYGATYVAD